MTRGSVRVHAKWMAKGLMIVEHTAAIEATLRLDETIGLMADQRSRVAAVLSVVGWRPPALVVSTVEELNALADGAVVLDVAGFVMLKQSSRWLLPGEEYEYHRSAADPPGRRPGRGRPMIRPDAAGPMNRFAGPFAPHGARAH